MGARRVMGGFLTGALVLVGLTAAGTTAVQAEEPDFSQFDPPPLCSALPPNHDRGCIQQPGYYVPDDVTPLLIDMPTMNLYSDTTTQNRQTGEVTFTITQHASGSNRSTRPPTWAKRITLLNLIGYSDPDAGDIGMFQVGDCDGRITCTYTTSETELTPGWYRASEQNGILANERLCPAVGSCTSAYSESAVYVPREDDLRPPIVRAAAVGRGLTTKAVADAVDPAGKGMQLTWDFGDGTQRAGQLGKVVSHTYAVPGDYYVTANVRTSDGRHSADSVSAMILPPRPVLQVVARHGTTMTGAAAGLLQGWPAGVRARAVYWRDGCPTDVDEAQYSTNGSTLWVPVKEDGSVSVDFHYLHPDATGFALEAEGHLDFGSGPVRVHRLSDCVSELDTSSQTTGRTEIGDTTVPVASDSVPVGNVAVIDAGKVVAGEDVSEHRVVKAHGSLIVDALARAHDAEAHVLDAGTPPGPYVVPDPPTEDPEVPELPEVDGVEPSVPEAPSITKVIPKKAGHKVVIRFEAGFDGGDPITKFQAKCIPVRKGQVRKAAGESSPVKVKRLTKKKPYRCKVKARNGEGFGPWSRRSEVFKAK